MRKLCIAIALAIAFVVPASSFGNNADDNACDLIRTSATFKAALGGTTLQFERNLTAHSSKQNGSGALHSVCNGEIWRGPKPASRQAALAALHAGRASLFAIDTWEPDDQSPYADKWLAKQFPLLVKNGAGIPALPGLPNAAQYNVHAFKPKKYGLGARGVLAQPLPGVTAGGAMWWKASEGEVVFVSIGAGSGRPVQAELNKVGALLVGAFGMGG
jgi:hypothetical protein